MRHRFFTAAATTATLVLAPSCERTDAAEGEGVRESTTRPATATTLVTPDEPVPPLQCLRSTRGTALMAIVHADGATTTERPDGGGATRALQRWMPPYCVFDVDPPSALEDVLRGDTSTARALLVGETVYVSSVLGWVRADQCLLRDHRMCAQLTKGELEVYASLGDIAEVLEARAPGREPRVAPFARSRPGARDGLPWPIDEVSVEAAGSTTRVYRLHFLGARGGDRPVADTVPERRMTEAELRAAEDRLRVQCMVVCDVTGSMNPWWEQVRKFLATDFAGGLAAMGAAVDLGLVIYRDVTDEETSFELRHHDLRAGVDTFVEELDDVAVGGGGDNPEATLRAVSAALERTTWSDSPLTRRMLFVVSDAPSHENQGVGLDDVVRAAERRGVAIHGLVVGDRKGAERELQERQFERLATGTGGTTREIHDFPALLATLASEVDAQRRQQTDAKRVLRPASAGATAGEIAATHGMSVERVRSILEFLSDAGLELGESDAPRLATGYVLPASADHALEKRILTTRHAVRTVEFLLQCLVQDYDPAKQRKSLGGLIVPALEASTVVRDARQPLDLYCKLRGIPLLKDGELLALSLTEIARLSSTRRGELRSQLMNTVLPRVTLLLKDKRHWPFESAAGTWGFMPGDGL